MADEVERIMERMIPELEDLEDKGIMTRKEVGGIAGKRRDFEYLLQRTTVKLVDYKRYIEFEKNLARLVEKRRKRLSVKKDGKYRHGPKRQICHIYNRAVTKFSGNTDLWMEAIQNAVDTKSTNIASKLIGRALQIFPRNENLWIFAGGNEFEKGDMSAARAMMQRGLRLNKTKQRMWEEYFRLEFRYLHKLRARRIVLGIDKEEGESKTESKGDGSDAEEDTEKFKNSILYKGTLLKIVYEKAIEAIPEDITFRANLAEVAASFFDSPIKLVATDIARTIWSDIESVPTLVSSPEYWNGRALFELKYDQSVDTAQPVKKKQKVGKKEIEPVSEENVALSRGEIKAQKVFLNGLEVAESAKLREYAADFYFSRLNKELSKNKGNKGGETKKAAVLRECIEKLLYFKDGDLIELKGKLTARSCEILCKVFSGSKYLDYSLKVHDSNSKFASILVSGFKSLTKENESAFQRFFERISLKDDGLDSLEIWLKYLELSIESDTCTYDDVMKRYKQCTIWFVKHAKKTATLQRNLQLVFAALFLWVSQSDSPGEYLPRAFRQVLSWGIPPVLPVNCFLEYLNAAASKISPDDLRFVFDKATESHPTNKELWTKYLEFERTTGSIKDERRILLRAGHILENK
eukprot:CAMPEP_0184028330 /NCGR_PEP_ID=MMETSP0954-20121128/14758_1 /TAXON_ID=627963 /ORGANISM="Aplanochytrium sp, Strain PBS07" /LENGTH=635 /DNA_ID=CAMNT_0026313117 /DNA_START=33 /DNA_END=1940 /DNA_ORIENTATION=+